MRCRPVEASPAAAAAAASAEDELIDSLGVCAAISTVSRYLPHCANTNFNVRVCSSSSSSGSSSRILANVNLRTNRAGLRANWA